MKTVKNKNYEINQMKLVINNYLLRKKKTIFVIYLKPEKELQDIFGLFNNSIGTLEFMYISKKKKTIKALMIFDSVIGYNDTLTVAITEYLDNNIYYSKLVVKEISVDNIVNLFCGKFFFFNVSCDEYYIAEEKIKTYTHLLYSGKITLFKAKYSIEFETINNHCYDPLSLVNMLGWYMQINHISVSNGNIYKKVDEFNTSWDFSGSCEQWLKTNYKQIIKELRLLFKLELKLVDLDNLMVVYYKHLLEFFRNENLIDIRFENDIIEMPTSYFDLKKRSFLEKANVSYNTILYCNKSICCKNLDLLNSIIIYLKKKIVYVVFPGNKKITVEINKLVNLPKNIGNNYGILYIKYNLIFGFEKKDLTDIGLLEIKLNKFIDESLCWALLTAIVIVNENKKNLILVEDLI